MKLIYVKRFGSNGLWYASADFTGGEWVPTPYFGVKTFCDVAQLLIERNPGYEVLPASLYVK